MASSHPPPWSDLPYHVLSLVIDRLESSPAAAVTGRRVEDDDTIAFRLAYRSHHTAAAADRARFRAVCRSWHTAVHEHLTRPPRRQPWTVLSDGSFMTGSDDDTKPLPSWPMNATCIDTTDDWLAIQRAAADDDDAHTTHYLLHNPFSGMTVRLPELDAIIGNSSELFKVRKVLMRSGPRDVVAVMTNNYNYPIILVRPGKGVWLPRPRSAPFIYIIDMVFIGEKLYGITLAEDLISISIAFDDDGKPTVTGTKRVIRHNPESDDDSDVWGYADSSRVIWYISPLDDAYDLWSDVDERYRQDEVDSKDEDNNETGNEDRVIDPAEYEIMKNYGDDTISEATEFEENDNGFITTTWHIIESLGKLLMIKRNLQWPSIVYTRSADVFEANITTGAWVPLTAGLDGQALFISRFNSKSIHACGEVEKDAVYFVDTGDVLNMKSQIISQPRRELHYRSSMWIFPPEILV